MIKVPKIVERYYPELTWRILSNEKSLFLTFDDGPTPGVTDWVLDKLKEYNAKATFFCIGRNVMKYPMLFRRLRKEGHSIGNHTFDHKKGWTAGNYDYIRNVMKCHEIVPTDLFRPPYGRIKKVQIKLLLGKFRIIMWDVLSEDYNRKISPEKCFQNVVKQANAGSIIVFHDSLKAERNVKETLPRLLAHYQNLGFNFKAIQ